MFDYGVFIVSIKIRHDFCIYVLFIYENNQNRALVDGALVYGALVDGALVDGALVDVVGLLL